jgi:hypothetical protein
MLLLVNLLIVSAISIQCDVIRFGKCPVVMPQQDFQNKLFSGLWFEIARNPILPLSGTKCNRIEFQLKGIVYQVKSSFYNK